MSFRRPALPSQVVHRARLLTRLASGWCAAMLLASACAGRAVARAPTGGDRAVAAAPTSVNRGPLHPATQETLRGLPRPVEVVVCVTADPSREARSDARDVQWLVHEYRAASAGKVTVRVAGADEVRREATAGGCDAQMPPHPDISRLGEGASLESLRDFYRCIVLHEGARTTHIDIEEQGAPGLEYALTTALRTLFRGPIPIGVLTGHGEGTLETELAYLPRMIALQYGDRYQLTTVDLAGGEREVPASLGGLIIAGPRRGITPRETRRIDEHLARGGGVTVLAGAAAIDGELMSPVASVAEHGLDTWLAGHGIVVHEDVVLDMHGADAVMDIPEGRARVRMLALPRLPPEALDRAHPLTRDLPGLTVSFASSLTVDGARAAAGGRTVTVLGRTSAESVTQSRPFALDAVDLLMQREALFAHPTGPHAIAVAIEGAFPSASGAASAQPGRLAVVSSSQMAYFATLRATAPFDGTSPANITFLTNAMAWMSDRSGLDAIRARTPLDSRLGSESAPGDGTPAVSRGVSASTDASTRP